VSTQSRVLDYFIFLAREIPIDKNLIVMELAVLLAAGLRDWVDFGVIIAILLLNAIVGWYQEKQAADVVASLKGDIAMRSTVVRNGQEIEIKARELVPGDIVSLFPTPNSQFPHICDWLFLFLLNA
jgi:magnesium-transporting ATPase (P-type)